MGLFDWFKPEHIDWEMWKLEQEMTEEEIEEARDDEDDEE